MFLHFLGVTRLLAALEHRQGAIPFHAQVFQFLRERFALEAFLFEDGLQPPKALKRSS